MLTGARTQNTATGGWGEWLLVHTAISSSPEMGFPGGSAGKEYACNVGDLGLIPGL